MALSAIICLLLGLLGFTFSRPLLMLYTTNELALDFGRQRMTIICFSQFLCSLMEITTGLLRGIFKPVPAMISSVAGICGLRVLWVKTVFARYHNYTLLYLSYPVSWFLSFVVQGIMFLYYFKKYKNSLKAEEV